MRSKDADVMANSVDPDHTVSPDLSVQKLSIFAVLLKKTGYNFVANFYLQCNRLEEIGCDSLVIVVSGADRIKMGSKKGRNYLDDFTDFIEEFCHYCRGKV